MPDLSRHRFLKLWDSTILTAQCPVRWGLHRWNLFVHIPQMLKRDSSHQATFLQDSPVLMLVYTLLLHLTGLEGYDWSVQPQMHVTCAVLCITYYCVCTCMCIFTKIVDLLCWIGPSGTDIAPHVRQRALIARDFVSGLPWFLFWDHF